MQPFFSHFVYECSPLALTGHGSVDCVNGTWVSLFNQWQKFMANPVALITRIRVGGILTPRLVDLAERLSDVMPRSGEQRADQNKITVNGPRTVDASHARWSRTTQEMVDKCLSIVVGRVRQCDVACTRSIGRVCQKLHSNGTHIRFALSFAGGTLCLASDSQLFTQRFNELLISVRC